MMMLPGSRLRAVRALATTNPRETSFMRYFASRLGSDAGGVLDEWIPFPAISPLLVAAAVKNEDLRFFEHRGVNWNATTRKTLRLLLGRYSGGASTITQQLARNLYLTPSRTVTRKLREMRLALAIERAIPKTRVLELYLNVIEFGRGVWGCAAAGRHYFGRASADFDLFESTFLIVLLPAPKAGVSGAHAFRCYRMQRMLAFRMFISGLVSADECAACCERVDRLHLLISGGMDLQTALASSRTDTDAAATAAVLREIGTVAEVAPVPPSDALASRLAYSREYIAFQKLRLRVGPEALQRAFAAGSLDPLGFGPQAAA